MSFFLANPWGLLAFGAIPLLVGIYFLRERSREVHISTLFLLKHSHPTTTGGLRFEQFRNTFPFWLQILAICILTWLLTEPRWLRIENRYTMVVVLDSSASMQAFKNNTLSTLTNRLNKWSASAKQTDWHLLETGPRRPPLYAGSVVADLLKAADEQWDPNLGHHQFMDSLMVARSLIPADGGQILFVTDHETDLPADIAVLSCGTAIDNVGISGASVTQIDGRTQWHVLVTNHSMTTQSRTFTVQAVGKTTLDQGQRLRDPQTVTLNPGTSKTLSSQWPAEWPTHIVMALSPDQFALDDLFPLTVPQPRIVNFENLVRGSDAELLVRMISAADDVAVKQSTDQRTADLVIDHINDLKPRNSILLTTDRTGTSDGSTDKKIFEPGWIAAEDHPLVSDLGWGSLLTGPVGEATLSPSDEPLLWKGNKAMAFLRPGVSENGDRVDSLILNWDLSNSSAEKSIPFLILIRRFIEHVREDIPRSWSENFETGQMISLPNTHQVRAPDSPCFFTKPLARTQAGDSQKVHGSAQFVDTREADFIDAKHVDTLAEAYRTQVFKQSEEDPWKVAWISLATAALLLAWSRRASQ